MYKLKNKKMKSQNISVNKNSADKGESFLLEPSTTRVLTILTHERESKIEEEIHRNNTCDRFMTLWV